jgi:hypothetical protein
VLNDTIPFSLKLLSDLKQPFHCDGWVYEEKSSLLGCPGKAAGSVLLLS